MLRTKLIILFTLITALAFTQNRIDEILESYKKDKDLVHANYSFCIIDANSGKIIKDFNSEMALIPASTLKIITTSAALGILGKNYTYKTNFYITQKKDSLHSNGDILIKGSGDPTLNSAYFYSNDSNFFSPLIKKLKTNSNKLSETIYADASIFDNLIPDGWIWGDMGNYFGAGANSISYKDNKFSLFYSSSVVNSVAILQSIKPSYFEKCISVQSNVIANGSEDNAYVYGAPNSYSRAVKGTIPPNKKNYEVEAQMPDPALALCYELKQELLKNKLINSVNTSSIINEKYNHYPYSTKQLIYSHSSPPLEKIVFYTNIKSNNHYAESLLKTIGAAKYNSQGSNENGIKAIENYWKERGVDVSGLHMEDGSGLSRANTVTTKLQATILSKIYRDSLIYPSFNASLPIAGKNGSMASLCKGTFAENNLRAKTGYINRARGYCGYVKTKTGKELAFSVLFNNYDCTAKEMKIKIEKLLVALVDL